MRLASLLFSAAVLLAALPALATRDTGKTTVKSWTGGGGHKVAPENVTTTSRRVWGTASLAAGSEPEDPGVLWTDNEGAAASETPVADPTPILQGKVTLSVLVALDRWAERPKFVRPTDRVRSSIASYGYFDRRIATNLSANVKRHGFFGRSLDVTIGMSDEYEVDRVEQILSRLRASDPVTGKPDFRDLNGDGQYVAAVDELIWYETRRRRYDSRFTKRSPSVAANWLDADGNGLKLSFRANESNDAVIGNVFGDISAGAIRYREGNSSLSASWIAPLGATGFRYEVGVSFDLKRQKEEPLFEAGRGPRWTHFAEVPYTWMDWGDPQDQDELEVNYGVPPGFKWWQDIRFNPFWECASDGHHPSSWTGYRGYGFLPTDHPEMPVRAYAQGGVGYLLDARRSDLSISTKISHEASDSSEGWRSRWGLVGTHNLTYTLGLTRSSVTVDNSDPSGGPLPYFFLSHPNSTGSTSTCVDRWRYLGTRSDRGQGEQYYEGDWWQTAFGVPLRPTGQSEIYIAQGNPNFEADPLNPAALSDPGIAMTVRSQQLTLGVSDRFAPSAVKWLSVSGAVDWIPQILYRPDGSRGLTIYDNLAPRLGFFAQPDPSVIVGVSGRRQYDPLPSALYTHAFSREATWGRSYSNAGLIYREPDPNLQDPGSFDYWRVIGGSEYAIARKDTRVVVRPFGNNARNRVETVAGTGAFDVSGQHSDLIELFFKKALARSWWVGAWYERTELRELIEDASLDGGYTFTVGNPGRGALSHAYAPNPNARTLTFTDPTIYDDPPRFVLPRPRRRTTQLGFQLKRDFGAEPFRLEFVYNWNRHVGNVPLSGGDAIDQNFSHLYDLPELTTNSYGPLPSDQTHFVFVDLAGRLPLRYVGTLEVGFDHTLRSGAPIDVRGPHFIPSYSYGDLFILPRGAGGRLPEVHRTDVFVTWHRALGRFGNARFTVRIWNVFNRQAVTAVEDRLILFEQSGAFVGAANGVRPLEGGNVGDLPRGDEPNRDSNLRFWDPDSPGKLTGAEVSPYYGKPIAHQQPRWITAEFAYEF